MAPGFIKKSSEAFHVSITIQFPQFIKITDLLLIMWYILMVRA